MTKDSLNLYLAIGLSFLVIVGWSYLFAPKPSDRARLAEAQRQAQPAGATAPGAPAISGELAPLAAAPETRAQTRAQALAAAPRVKIDTPAISGSLSLRGARLDDVALKAYRETVDPNSPNIVLLSPPGAPDAYYAEAGFLAPAGSAPGSDLALPGPGTLWRADRDVLTPQSPVTLTYDNGAGLVFRRTIAVDERYMFTIS